MTKGGGDLVRWGGRGLERAGEDHITVPQRLKPCCACNTRKREAESVCYPPHSFPESALLSYLPKSATRHRNYVAKGILQVYRFAILKPGQKGQRNGMGI